jgi:hypothetical protein
LTLADVIEELERLGVHDFTSVTFATPLGPVLAVDGEYDIRREGGVPIVFLGDPADWDADD